jgi:hypothetical protein
MHAGALLALLGGMVTSEPAHEIWRDLLRSKRVHTGQIQLYPGQQTDEMYVFDQEDPDSGPPEAHPLGFTVQLNDFQVHYYPWRLEAVVPDSEQDDSWVSREIDWKLDQWVSIPRTPAEVKVTKYVERIEHQLPPTIRVFRNTGRQYAFVAELPGTPEAKVEIDEANIEITVRQILPDPMGVPAAALLEVTVDGQARQVYAFAPNHPMQQRMRGEFRAEFYLPVDPEDMRQPGYMDLVIRHGGREVRHRLQSDPREGTGRVVLQNLFPNDPAMHERALDLNRSIKDYLSRVSVLVDGKHVKQKVVEVNHPLHYGGYHLYQMSWGRDERGAFTVLTVRSDRGWNMVWAGLTLIMLGAFWQLWFVPAWKWWKRRSRHGA